MMFRLFACIALLGSTAFADWPRYLSGEGKGDSTDSPPAHPLAYFKADPCLRPASDALVRAFGCTYPGRPAPTEEERKSWSKTVADVVEIGKIGASTIYDLWYQRKRGFYPDFDLRSVLVKVDENQYREISVHPVRIRSSFPPSEIVNLGGEPVLVVKFHDGGNNPFIKETLYMFRSAGAETPDFSAIGKAVEKLKPSNMSPVIDKNDYASMTYGLELYKNDTGLPRVSVTERGRIIVTYRFTNGRAVVTGSKLELYSQ